MVRCHTMSRGQQAEARYRPSRVFSVGLFSSLPDGDFRYVTTALRMCLSFVRPFLLTGAVAGRLFRPLAWASEPFPGKNNGRLVRLARTRIDHQWLVAGERQLPLEAAARARSDKRDGRTSGLHGNHVLGAPARHLQSHLSALTLAKKAPSSSTVKLYAAAWFVTTPRGTSRVNDGWLAISGAATTCGAGDCPSGCSPMETTAVPW